jgi:tetratricopeptide (TPR) repeat protein
MEVNLSGPSFIGPLGREMESSSTKLEVGRLYLERGDVLKAIDVLEPLAIKYLAEGHHDLYLDTLHMLFRGYAELLDFDKISQTKDVLTKLVEEKGIKLTGKIYYTLALCSSYKHDHDQALEYCQKSLVTSLAEDNKESVCYAILGLAISYYNLDRLQDSLKEIYNLQIFMNVMDLSMVRLSAHILKGQILRKMHKYDQALDVLWQSYELLKVDKNFYSYLSLLYGLALTYKESGRADEARGYLRLAQRSIDKNNLKRLSSLVDGLLTSLGEEAHTPYDLIFNTSDHSVVEKKKGRVDFNNQFILMDLLKLFLTNPGVSFSKEQLVKQIWRQSYNPAVHDNKIYVTIKRLRQLIEPEIEKPKYIFRSKDGYYFNHETKVLFEEEKREKV